MHSIGDFMWSMAQQRSMKDRPTSGRPADRRRPVNYGSQGRSVWAMPKALDGAGGEIIRGARKPKGNQAGYPRPVTAIGIPEGGKWNRPFI